MDARSYEEPQETMPLLRLLALGNGEIESGKFVPRRISLPTWTKKIRCDISSRPSRLGGGGRCRLCPWPPDLGIVFLFSPTITHPGTQRRHGGVMPRRLCDSKLFATSSASAISPRDLEDAVFIVVGDIQRAVWPEHKTGA